MTTAKRKVKLGNICEIVTGSTPSTRNREYWNGDNKWVTPAEIKENSFMINDTVKHISDSAVNNSGLKRLPVGTVLLSSRAPIGKVAIVGSEMYCNQGFKNLICGPDIRNEYLYYFLKYSNNFLNSLGRGATFKEISSKIVKNIEIRLPSLATQDRRIHFLKMIDSLLKRLINENHYLDDLVKSRFIETFGDPQINSLGLPEKLLGSISENLDSKRIPITSSNRVSGPYPYYGASGIVDSVEGYIFDEDLLLISEDGANLVLRSTPIAFSVKGKIWVNNHAHVLKFKNLQIQKYVEILFSMIDISDLITGSAQPKFNQKQLSSLSIPIPEQRVLEIYYDFLEKIDKSKLAIQKSINELETLKKKLMQEYFG